MENTKVMIYDDEDFECYKSGNIGIIKIKKNVFEIVTDLPESSKLMQSMNALEKDIKIIALLIINENGCLGEAEYTKYLNKVFAHKVKSDKWTDLEISNQETRTRQLIILNSLIRKIVHSNKIIVSASRGEIVTPFLGAALAADLRYASEDTVYLLSHTKLNVHPSGALPYFLTKYIGHAKATQILYYSDQITAHEAFKLNIINKILPVNNFEENCIENIVELVERGHNALKCTKKLLTYNFEDMDKYLNMEECNYMRR